MQGVRGLKKGVRASLDRAPTIERSPHRIVPASQDSPVAWNTRDCQGWQFCGKALEGSYRPGWRYVVNKDRPDKYTSDEASARNSAM